MQLVRIAVIVARMVVCIAQPVVMVLHVTLPAINDHRAKADAAVF